MRLSSPILYLSTVNSCIWLNIKKGECFFLLKLTHSNKHWEVCMYHRDHYVLWLFCVESQCI